MVPRFRLLRRCRESQSRCDAKVCGDHQLGLSDDSALLDFPLQKGALNTGFELGWEGFLDATLIAQLISFCYCSLVDIPEQRRKPFDVFVWLFQQLSDSYGVMKASREP